MDENDMLRPKSWLPSMFSKPKNPHSLDQLKYLYSVLGKNQSVTEGNRTQLVETLRSISEILIWGDQNDSSVFDFFLEKNMLSFFLHYLRQRFGRFICVQLLQTLNILFENISNETSLYYLLSNNHINAIIVHKFDFSDEEVMAYYISFLKTLSFKLNKHTVHFFYNEHTNDFALYTEAIKFFNHSENMVRIAVRTITLNVYKVDDRPMVRYIRDKTATPYYSNLVWFIGSHIVDLDCIVRNDSDHQNLALLSDMVADHLDHLHYVNDILCINISTLNDVLTEQLLNRLFIPLYVYSMTKRKKYQLTAQQDDKKHVGSVVALFLLSQVFLIISYAPLVRQLAEIILNGNISLTIPDVQESDPTTSNMCKFLPPPESLMQTFESSSQSRRAGTQGGTENGAVGSSVFYNQAIEIPSPDEVISPSSPDLSSPNQNSTDDEKVLSTLGYLQHSDDVSHEQRQAEFTLTNRPYLEAIFVALECNENDYDTLFALCLLYAMGHNGGIHQGLLDSVLMPTDRSETKDHYNVVLVERLIHIITLACQPTSRVRLTTLELAIKLLKQMVYKNGRSYLQDRHLACVEHARETSSQLLRGFYKSEEIFLDMFEDEYREMQSHPLNVEFLMMDASFLLPPAGTPLTGIEFNRRLPCGEVERARRAIRVFFMLRDLSLTLLNETEASLPLTKAEQCVKADNVLDLNNSDLIACTVMTQDSRKQERRFLVIDSHQVILVEPDTKRLGWGVVRFVGFLQDVEVSGDKDDSRSLHVTVHMPSRTTPVHQYPLLRARFIFDDHIRCMAAKQRLCKGRLKARQNKMHSVERMLDISTLDVCGIVAAHGSVSMQPGHPNIPGRSHPVRSQSGSHRGSLLGSGQQAVPARPPPPLAGIPSSRANPNIQAGNVQTNLASRTQPHIPSPQQQQNVNQMSSLSAQSQSESGKISPTVTIHRTRKFGPISPNNKNNSSALPQIRSRKSNQILRLPLTCDAEEAEEAVEATSASAFQSLNPPSTSITPSSSPQRNGSKQSSSSLDAMAHSQDIPLEDMSRSPVRPPDRVAIVDTVLAAHIHQVKVRSHSHSPRRLHGTSSPIAIPGIDKSRSRSLSSTPENKTILSRKVRNRTLSGDTDMDNGSSGSTYSTASEEICSKSLTTESPPKSLRPAAEPTTSLLNDPAIETLDSPKLLPPREPDRVHSYSERRSTRDSAHPVEVSHAAESSSSSKERSSKRTKKRSMGVQTSPASTSDQLTRFAQMVQQHYSYEDDEKHAVKPSTKSGKDKSSE